MNDERPIFTTSWIVEYNEGQETRELSAEDLVSRICKEENIEKGDFTKFDRIFRDENGFYAIEMADRARKIDATYDYGPDKRFKDRRSWRCSILRATQEYGVIRKKFE